MTPLLRFSGHTGLPVLGVLEAACFGPPWGSAVAPFTALGEMLIVRPWRARYISDVVAGRLSRRVDAWLNRKVDA